MTSHVSLEHGMIRIPAGEFIMGSEDWDIDAYEDEKRAHRAYLPDYDISKYPVTNAQFEWFVRATAYPTDAERTEMENEYTWRHPRGKGSHISNKTDYPVVNVNWHDALAYCNWLSRATGKAYRLPT